MRWNWQSPDWPNFHWDRTRLSSAEERILLGSGVVLGAVKHLGEDQRNLFLVEAMSAEAVTTSEIEGEILNRASVQSSIQRQLGLAADKRRATPGEQGIAETMVDLYRSFSEPVTHEMLFRWRRLVTVGRETWPMWDDTAPAGSRCRWSPEPSAPREFILERRPRGGFRRR